MLSHNPLQSYLHPKTRFLSADHKLQAFSVNRYIGQAFEIDDIKYLGQTLVNGCEELFIQNSKIDAANTQAFAEVLPLANKLHILDLNHCTIANLALICRALKQVPTLKNLSLVGNLLSHDDVLALIDLLNTHPKLMGLEISPEHIGAEDLILLFNCFSNNRKLKILKFGLGDLDINSQTALIDAINVNPYLEVVDFSPTNENLSSFKSFQAQLAPLLERNTILRGHYQACLTLYHKILAVASENRNNIFHHGNFKDSYDYYHKLSINLAELIRTDYQGEVDCLVMLMLIMETFANIALAEFEDLAAILAYLEVVTVAPEQHPLKLAALKKINDQFFTHWQFDPSQQLNAVTHLSDLYRHPTKQRPVWLEEIIQKLNYQTTVTAAKILIRSKLITFLQENAATLQNLTFEDCSLDSNLTTSFCDTITRCQQLNSITIAHNADHFKNISKILISLHTQPQLQRISFSHTLLNRDNFAAGELNNLIRDNKSLTELDLSWTCLNKADLQQVFHALADNTTLTNVKILGYDIDEESRAALHKMLDKNLTLLQFEITHPKRLEFSYEWFLKMIDNRLQRNQRLHDQHQQLCQLQKDLDTQSEYDVEREDFQQTLDTLYQLIDLNYPSAINLEQLLGKLLFAVGKHYLRLEQMNEALDLFNYLITQLKLDQADRNAIEFEILNILFVHFHGDFVFTTKLVDKMISSADTDNQIQPSFIARILLAEARNFLGSSQANYIVDEIQTIVSALIKFHATCRHPNTPQNKLIEVYEQIKIIKNNITEMMENSNDTHIRKAFSILFENFNGLHSLLAKTSPAVDALYQVDKSLPMNDADMRALSTLRLRLTNMLSIFVNDNHDTALQTSYLQLLQSVHQRLFELGQAKLFTPAALSELIAFFQLPEKTQNALAVISTTKFAHPLHTQAAQILDQYSSGKMNAFAFYQQLKIIFHQQSSKNTFLKFFAKEYRFTPHLNRFLKLFKTAFIQNELDISKQEALQFENKYFELYMTSQNESQNKTTSTPRAKLARYALTETPIYHDTNLERYVTTLRNCFKS